MKSCNCKQITKYRSTFFLAVTTLHSHNQLYTVYSV